MRGVNLQKYASQKIPNCVKLLQRYKKMKKNLFLTYTFITSPSQSVWRRWATWRWQQKATLRWWTWLRCTWRHGCPWPPCSSSWAGRSVPSRPWSPCMTAKHWHRTHQLHKRQGHIFWSFSRVVPHFPGLFCSVITHIEVLKENIKTPTWQKCEWSF